MTSNQKTGTSGYAVLNDIVVHSGDIQESYPKMKYTNLVTRHTLSIQGVHGVKATTSGVTSVMNNLLVELRFNSKVTCTSYSKAATCRLQGSLLISLLYYELCTIKL
jgi:hypothetical protein